LTLCLSVTCYTGFAYNMPIEWALLSKNVIAEDDLLNPVWNDLSSPRNKYQLEHGAVYPNNLGPNRATPISPFGLSEHIIHKSKLFIYRSFQKA
jgi:hypothetical protein